MSDVTLEEIELLARQLHLTLTAEEKQTLFTCFSSYREQLARLHELKLDGEDVAQSFSLSTETT